MKRTSLPLLAARVHHAARRRGGVAAGGARAAAERCRCIGLLGGGAPQRADRTAAFHRGLGEMGYVEDRNVAIEQRWADGRYERLPPFAANWLPVRWP